VSLDNIEVLFKFFFAKFYYLDSIAHIIITIMHPTIFKIRCIVRAEEEGHIGIRDAVQIIISDLAEECE
jgi:hypothetical protein